MVHSVSEISEKTDKFPLAQPLQSLMAMEATVGHGRLARPVVDPMGSLPCPLVLHGGAVLAHRALLTASSMQIAYWGLR